MLTHNPLSGFFLLAPHKWSKEKIVDLGGLSIAVSWSVTKVQPLPLPWMALVFPDSYHMHPLPHSPHSNTKFAFLGGDGRQGLKQEVKVSPQLSFSFSWKPKQTRHHICALPLSYQKQGGQHDQIHALKWSDKGIQQHSWHIPFSSRLTSWGHSTGCMPVTWHLKLCPVLVPISPHYNDQGDSISVPPQHFKKLYISHQIKCH